MDDAEKIKQYDRLTARAKKWAEDFIGDYREGKPLKPYLFMCCQLDEETEELIKVQSELDHLREAGQALIDSASTYKSSILGGKEIATVHTVPVDLLARLEAAITDGKPDRS